MFLTQRLSNSLHTDWSIAVLGGRLDLQPLFGKRARAASPNSSRGGTKTERERAVENELILGVD